MNFHYAFLLYGLNVIIAFVIIFLERRKPNETLAWVLVLFFLPILGTVLYLIFAQNISRRKIYRLSDEEEELVRSSLDMQIQTFQREGVRLPNSDLERWQSAIELNQVHGNSFLTQMNQVDLITDGHEFLDAILTAINNARYKINMEFFIFKDDRVGSRVLKALERKAKDGVEIRLLVDALGSRRLGRHHIKKLVNHGGKVAYFFKPLFKYITLNLNYRNHRKIMVVDDAVAFVGGFNIGKEYLGYKRKFGYWRDTHLIIRGNAVQDLNAVFLLDWRVASKERLELEENYGYPVESFGSSALQIVSSGPNSDKEEIKTAMMKMIAEARDKIYLQTPYFVPDDSMMEILIMAAQSGVEVNVMIPSIPDHPFVYWANYFYCGRLLEAGANIYIYQKGFLHAKTLMVDNQVATVGSANFDRRSFRLNFETNAIIYDDVFAEKMETAFKDDVQSSKKLTLREYRDRSVWVQVKEAISILVSDIL